MFMKDKTFEFGKELKVTCRKPTSAEIYIHQMLKLLFLNASEGRSLSNNSDFYLRQNGYNNDV